MELETLNIFHDGLDTIRNLSYFLKNWSMDFRSTGNTQVADDLLDMATNLSTTAKKMNDAIAKDISIGMKRSEEDAWGTVKMCLDSILAAEANVSGG